MGLDVFICCWVSAEPIAPAYSRRDGNGMGVGSIIVLLYKLYPGHFLKRLKIID